MKLMLARKKKKLPPQAMVHTRGAIAKVVAVGIAVGGAVVVVVGVDAKEVRKQLPRWGREYCRLNHLTQLAVRIRAAVAGNIGVTSRIH